MKEKYKAKWQHDEEASYIVCGSCERELDIAEGFSFCPWCGKEIDLIMLPFYYSPLNSFIRFLMEGCMRNNKYQHSLNDAIRNSDFSCKNDTFYNLQELVDMYSFSTPEEREELEKRTIQRKARDDGDGR